MPWAGFPYELPAWIPGPPSSALLPPELANGFSPIPDSFAVAVARLRQRLLVTAGQARPNVLALIQVYCNQIDDLEDAFQALYYYRQLANAYGQLLDDIGVLVGLGRNGLDDATYRLYLQAQIRADNSAGTTEDLNAIFALLTTGLTGVTFDVEWQPPAAFIIYLTDANGILTQIEVNAFASFMNRARDAGVGGVLEYSIGEPDADLFSFMSSTDTFDGSGSGPTNSGVGFDQGFFRGAIRAPLN